MARVLGHHAKGKAAHEDAADKTDSHQQAGQNKFCTGSQPRLNGKAFLCTAELCKSPGTTVVPIERRDRVPVLLCGRRTGVSWTFGMAKMKARYPVEC